MADLIKAIEEGLVDKLQNLDISSLNNISQDGKKALHLAAASGHTAVVKLFIDKGLSSSDTPKDNDTALHLAAFNNHVDVIKLLLANNANVNALGVFGDSPLHRAASKGHTAAVKLLVEAGADVTIPGHLDVLTMASICNDTEVVKLFISKGAPIEGLHASTIGSPLYKAAEGGHIEVCKILLNAGADANSKGKCAPLVIGAAHLEVCRLLIEKGADVNAVDNLNKKYNPIEAAASNGNAELLKLLIEKGAKVVVDNRRNPVFIAASDGHLEAIRILKEKGGVDLAAIVDTVQPKPLLHYAVYSQDINLVKLVLDLGVPVDCVDSNKQTALMQACWKGRNDEIVKLLIERKANVKHQCDDGFTALHHAANDDRLEACKLLIAAGADRNVKNKYNDSALDCAKDSKRYNIISYFKSLQ